MNQGHPTCAWSRCLRIWEAFLFGIALCTFSFGAYGQGSPGIAYVQQASATPQGTAATVAVSFTTAQTAGDMNVVVVGWNDTTATVKSVTDSAGNAYKLAIGPTSGGGIRQSIYFAPNIAGGSDTVTVTFSQAAAYPDIRILEYRGVNALDAAAGASGSGANASSGPATTAIANELIFGANTVAVTTKGAGSGFTPRVITKPDSDLAEDRTVTSTGNYSATAVLSSGAWVMQMATFANASLPAAPALSALSCTTSSYTGAGSDACTVSLSAAAGIGGVAVALLSNNNAVTVPASVTVPAGSSSVGFTATVSSVTSAQTATLTGSLGGASKTYAISLGACVPALQVSASSLSFGSVVVSTSSAPQSVTLTSSGAAPLTISAGSVTGAGFTISGASFPLTLNPGQTATLSVVFSPTATGAVSGSITFTDNASPSTAFVSLSGTGLAPALSSLSCTTSSYTGAGSDACTVSLSAAAGTGGIAVALSSNNSAVTLPVSITVPAGSSSVGFTATVSSVTSAQTATVTASAGGVSKTFAISLGACVPALQVSASSLSFGNVVVNTSSAPQSVTLTSSGAAPLTISAGSVTGTGFTISGGSFPLTLNPGQTATLTVVFSPTATGAASGSITLTDNASPSTASVSLSGTGQLPAAPTVTGVSPSSGTTAGGTAVTITGTNFASGATVTFAGAAAANVNVVNSTTITAATPAGSAGAVTVAMTSSGQSGSLTGGFTYNAPAGISYVQQASATPQSTTATVNVTYPTAETAGDMNIVVVGWNDLSATVKSVTDSAGNVYVLAIGPTSGSGIRQSIYYAPNVVGGSDTVTVTFNQAAAYPDIRVLEYRGVTALDVAIGASGSGSTASSGSANTTTANELIFAADTISTTTAGAGSGFTARVVTTPDSDLAEDRTVSATGSYSATASLTSGSWVMQMATFANAPPPGPGVLSALSCSNSSMTGAGSDLCTVSLSSAAGTGGLAVSLSSNNGAVTVPASVTVPAGAGSAGFTANVSAVSSVQIVTMTASAGGITRTYTITLGACVPGLALGATNVAFGGVELNSPATQAVTVTSSGGAALTISAGSVTGAGFSITGLSFPMTLNPGQTATLYVQFDPTTAGAATGAVTLSSNASPGAATISLSGTGQTTSYQVDLTWNAPTNSADPVNGYNVYRSAGGGSSYQLVNVSVDSTTNYTDNSVQSGTAYSYYVKSVDAQGNESAPSNTFSVTVP